jgi:hypothetical protein
VGGAGVFHNRRLGALGDGALELGAGLLHRMAVGRHPLVDEHRRQDYRQAEHRGPHLEAHCIPPRIVPARSLAAREEVR